MTIFSELSFDRTLPQPRMRSIIYPSVSLALLVAMVTLTPKTSVAQAPIVDPAAVCQRVSDSQTRRQLQAEIDVTWPEHRRVTPLPDLFAGEEVCMTVAGTVNIDRRRYQERECALDWFGGLFCKQVWRVANNYMSPTQVPLAWRLMANDGAPGPSGTTSGDPRVNLQTPEGNAPQVRSSVALQGMIGASAGAFGRTSCGGEPATCSQGVYTVTLQIDSMPRVRALRAVLAENRLSFDEISGPRILNENLRASGPVVKTAFADALLGQARNQHAPASPERQQILELALDYASEPGEVRDSVMNALAESYVLNGQFGRAEAVSSEVARSGEAQIAAGRASPTLLLSVAEAHGTLAEVHWRPRAGLSNRAASEAAGSLRRARALLLTSLADFPLDAAAPATRERLGYFSMRLAQFLARSGNASAFEEGIDALRQARSYLPPSRRGRSLLADSDPITGQTLISVALQPERVALQTNWAETAWRLPLPSGWALSTFGSDPHGSPQHVLAAPLGSSPIAGSGIGRRLTDLISGGRSNSVFDGAGCVAATIGIGGGAFAIAEHHVFSSSTIERSRLIVSTRPDRPVEPGGRIDALAVARSPAGTTPATMVALAVALPQVDPGAARRISVRTHGLNAEGLLTEQPAGEALNVAAAGHTAQLRISADGSLVVLGVQRTPSEAANWTVLARDDAGQVAPGATAIAPATYSVRGELRCTGPGGTSEPIDDVLLRSGPQGSHRELLVIGQSCGLRRVVVPPAARPTLSADDQPLVSPAQFMTLVGDGSSQVRFAWMAPDQASIGTLSVRRGSTNSGVRVGLAFGLIPANPGTNPPMPAQVFASDLSPTALLGTAAPDFAVCRRAGGIEHRFPAVHEAIRVLGAERSEGGTIGPKIHMAVVGVGASIAAQPYGVAQASSSGLGQTSDIVLQDYTDYLISGEGPFARYWSLTADRNSVHRLLNVRGGGAASLILPDSSQIDFILEQNTADQAAVAAEYLQLIDSGNGPHGEGLRISFSTIPNNQRGVSIAGGACALPSQGDPNSPRPTGICNQRELAAHFDQGRQPRVQVVYRSGHTSGGVRRPVALAFLPPEAEAGRVTVIPLPITNRTRTFSYVSPESVTAVQALIPLAGVSGDTAVVVQSGDRLLALAPGQGGALGAALHLTEAEANLIALQERSVLSAAGRLLFVNPAVPLSVAGTQPEGWFLRLTIGEGGVTRVPCENCSPPGQETRSRLATLWGRPAPGFGGVLPLLAASADLGVIFLVRDLPATGGAPWLRLGFDETRSVEVADVAAGIPLAVIAAPRSALGESSERLVITSQPGIIQEWERTRAPRRGGSP